MVPVSAAVPACRRVQPLRTTLATLSRCDPAPAEILVYLDGNNSDVLHLVRSEFPHVKLLQSPVGGQGPGGGRNHLMAAATEPWVAHFDDDSYPAEPDYFRRVEEVILEFPNAAVLCAAINKTHIDPAGRWLEAFFPGCGHVMNREWFHRTSGYVPLPLAYNMEEVDMGLQLHTMGGVCLLHPALRVTHNHEPPARETTETQVGMLLNSILFPMLRYPPAAFPFALGTILRRTFRLIQAGEFLVLTISLFRVLPFLRRHLHHRATVPLVTLHDWLSLRRNPARIVIASIKASKL